MRCWNWDKNDKGEAVLTIYGDIVSEAWWETDVSLTDFYKEMCAVGSVDKIIVRINSSGGEVNAAMGMYNLLKTSSAEIEVIIDGYAASAATLVAMAGDVVKIPKSAIFMIHDPSAFGRGTAEDFRKTADNLDKYKACIIAAYSEKTGKDTEELSRMMSEESYMTGEEAVNEGFCDELCGDDADVFVNNCGIVYVNRVEAGKIPMKVHAKAKAADKKQNKGKEQEDMEIKNKEELCAAFPDLVQEIRDDAAKAERARIKDIEEITPPGFEDMAAKAKFEDVAEPVNYMKAVIAEQKKQGADFLASRRDEIKGSGAEGVKPEGKSAGGEEVKNGFESALDKMEAEKRGER